MIAENEAIARALINEKLNLTAPQVVYDLVYVGEFLGQGVVYFTHGDY